MKVLMFSCILATVLVFAQSQGIPIAKCPPGEHSVLYCPQRAEPSCDNPVLHEKFGACDIPQCFCNPPTIRNLKTNKCVLLSDCP